VDTTRVENGSAIHRTWTEPKAPTDAHVSNRRSALFRLLAAAEPETAKLASAWGDKNRWSGIRQPGGFHSELREVASPGAQEVCRENRNHLDGIDRETRRANRGIVRQYPQLKPRSCGAGIWKSPTRKLLFGRHRQACRPMFHSAFKRRTVQEWHSAAIHLSQ
jgi:hypothetical protein